MKIGISPRAEKQLRALQKVDQIAIAKKIRSLKTSEKVANTEILQNYKNIYRTRVGDFRIVFKKTKQQIHIILIDHRKDIYKLVGRILK